MSASITLLPSPGPAPAAPARTVRGSAEGEGTRLDARQAPAPSPRLSLDHATGLVVIEFRASVGRPEQSFPTAKELDAYRRHIGQHAEGSAPTATGHVAPATADPATPEMREA